MSFWRSRSREPPRNNPSTSPPINYGQSQTAYAPPNSYAPPPNTYAPSPNAYNPSPANYGAGTYFPPPPTSPYGQTTVAPQPSPSPAYLAPTATRSPYENYPLPAAAQDSQALALRGENAVYRPSPPPPLPPRQNVVSPAPYLSPQPSSQWSSPSPGRSPSPYQMPQPVPETRKKEPPKVRKILSLGMSSDFVYIVL